MLRVLKRILSITYLKIVFYVQTKLDMVFNPIDFNIKRNAIHNMKS